MFGLGFTEILVIMMVVLLVFGPEKLPELARTLGRTMWQLRRAADDFKSEISLSGVDLDFKRELNELRRLDSDHFHDESLDSPVIVLEESPSDEQSTEEPSANLEEKSEQ